MFREKRSGPIIVDLTGPQGNAYYLLGLVTSLKHVLPPWKTIKEVQEEMMSSDYEHLLEVFDGYFGQYVIMER